MATTTRGSNDSNFAFISHSIATFPNQQPKIDNMQLARRKRRRTSPTELSILEQEFAANCRPDRARRERIALKVGMTEKAVQIWFQNKRQSFRKRGRVGSAGGLGSGSHSGVSGGGAGIDYNSGEVTRSPAPANITTTTVNTNVQISGGLPTPPLSSMMPCISYHGDEDDEDDKENLQSRGPSFSIYQDPSQSQSKVCMTEEDGKAVLTLKQQYRNLELPMKSPLRPSNTNKMAITALISSPLKTTTAAKRQSSAQEDPREVECVSNLLSLRWASA